MSEQNDSTIGRQNEAESETQTLLRSPVIRTAIALVALAIVFVCVGFIILNLELSARAQPIEVESYPGAALVVQRRDAPGQDQLVFASDDAAEQVAQFYQERYDKDENETCVRIENELAQPGDPPFEITCNIDNSIINAHQSAIITIQPNTSADYSGKTLIYIKRYWQQ